MPRRNLRLILAGSLICYLCFIRAEHTPYARHLASAFRTIDAFSLVAPNDRSLFDGAMEGMVGLLNDRGDIHSKYIAARVAPQLDAELRQEFGGIGVMISVREKDGSYELVVLAPPEPGRPAAQQDIRAQDRILAIDGVLVADLDHSDRDALMDDILGRVRGPVGEPVRLSILHPGEASPVEVEVVRALIELDSVKGHTKLPDGSWEFRLADHPHIAHVRITDFGEKTPRELLSIIDRLRVEGVEQFILDLRRNPGGELSGTIEICDMFLEAGKVIVEIKDRRGRLLESYAASHDAPFADLKLVVLVDRESASASEIFAACLQDHHKARIIGERTYGKGTVQRLLHVGPPLTLRDTQQRSYLKLTTSSYWRPSGRNIHRMHREGRDSQAESADDDAEWGVSPDSGLAVTLSAEERAAYIIDRNRRDIYNPDGDALLDDLDETPDELKALLPFEDRAINLAIDALQSMP